MDSTLGSQAANLRKLQLRRLVLLLSAVLVLTFVAYVTTINFGFVFDDHPQIETDPHILSWTKLPEYFQRAVAGDYYRPLFMVWLLVNRTLFGLDPALWHLSSILAHLAVTLLVFFVVRRVRNDLFTALLSAALFGVHPAHIEAVAWISGVTEPLVALAVLGAFLAYLKAQSRERWRWFSLGLALLGLFAKETAVSLPLLIMAHAWLYRPGDCRERLAHALRTVLPYAVLTVLYLGIRSLVLSGIAHAINGMSWTEMMFTWPAMLWFYLEHLLFPAKLSIYYDTPAISSPGFFNFFLPLLLIIGMAAGLWYWSHRRGDRDVAFFALWMLITLAPVLYLRALNPNDIAHDRYLYLPSVGFCSLIAIAIRDFRWGVGKLRPHALQFVVASALVLTAGFSTMAQQLYYRSDLLLFYRAVSISPTSDGALNNLGVYLLGRGMYGEAIGFYRRAVQRNPRHWMAFYNLGFSLYVTGHPEEAEQALERSLAINPYYSASNAYLALAKAHRGDLDRAESLARIAIELEPTRADYYYVLGLVHQQQGKRTDTNADYRRALEIDPNLDRARTALQALEADRRSASLRKARTRDAENK